MDDIKHYDLHVLMFPWLAHGHISAFLELAKKLSQRNFYIYFCSTPINLASLKNQICPKTFPSIQLVELHLPTLPNLPPQCHTTKSLPLHLQSTLKTALDMAKPTFFDILASLRPDLLIYDIFQPWAPEVASQLSIPAIHFQTMGAAAFSYFMHNMISETAETEFPLSGIYFKEHEYNSFSQMLESYSNNVLDKDRYIQSVNQSLSIILIKTLGDIEAKYVEYISVVLRKEVLPVGILVQEPTNVNDKNFKFVEWLDTKEESSTVFVSFGSEYFMSREEIEEVAHGLEFSEVNFIWVIRFPEGEETKVDEVLPPGFLERIGERGMVVEGWVPQVTILRHPSIGGFVSHCGWSSVLEGMKLGVPLIAMPVHIDQPLNARLMVELGIAVEVDRDQKGHLARGEITKVIKQVVVNKGGDEIRRKMKEINDKMTKTGEDQLNVVVKKLMQLCNK